MMQEELEKHLGSKSEDPRPAAAYCKAMTGSEQMMTQSKLLHVVFRSNHGGCSERVSHCSLHSPKIKQLGRTMGAGVQEQLKLSGSGAAASKPNQRMIWSHLIMT